MAARKPGLGKGLDSLIPGGAAPKPDTKAKSTEEKTEEDAPTMVSIDKVEPNREQPRKKFDEEALRELSESIAQFGVISPLLVQDRKEYYEIIAGERRWRAAKLAGLKEVPAIIKHYTEKEIVEISLIENIQREDLNPIEEAVAYKRLLDEFNMKQEEIARRVSKSRTAVTNSMRLLKLDDRVQKMLIDEEITSGHARAILAVDGQDRQYEIAKQVVSKNLSVRDIEKLVKTAGTPKEVPPKDEALLAIYRDTENRLKTVLGTKVSIVDKGGQGKIEIEYYTRDELNTLVDLLQGIHRE